MSFAIRRKKVTRLNNQWINHNPQCKTPYVLLVELHFYHVTMLVQNQKNSGNNALAQDDDDGNGGTVD